MKKITLIALMLFTALGYAQVGINTNTPDASSALEIESTTGGILIPRLTETQRDAITEPATGLMIYQTNQTTGFYFFDGTVWTKIDGVAGPQGEAGSQGIQGTQGDIGLTGATGPSGANGADGSAGVQGAQGEAGSQGIQGTQGDIGLTGATGPSGANGANGSNGIDGTDGADGTNGPTEAYINALIAEAVAGLQDQIDNAQIGSITDVDGNTYNSLTYGDQVWTVENAEMVTYRDGTSIPEVTDNAEWGSLTTGAWAYYNNDPTKPRLYNWYAVMGIHDTDPNTPNKEFAPEGWHVTTDAEWTTLENHLIANDYNYDGTTTENKIAKAMASTTGWNSSTDLGAVGKNQSLNNSSGFNAFPEGGRYNDGSFNVEGYNAFFWSSELNPNLARYSLLSFNNSYLFRNYNYKQNGFSVRFVRD
jgi:uncharacterized protein (TIGR02145 family)